MINKNGKIEAPHFAAPKVRKNSFFFIINHDCWGLIIDNDVTLLIIKHDCWGQKIDNDFSLRIDNLVKLMYFFEVMKIGFSFNSQLSNVLFLSLKGLSKNTLFFSLFSYFFSKILLFIS